MLPEEDLELLELRVLLLPEDRLGLELERLLPTLPPPFGRVLGRVEGWVLRLGELPLLPLLSGRVLGREVPRSGAGLLGRVLGREVPRSGAGLLGRVLGREVPRSGCGLLGRVLGLEVPRSGCGLLGRVVTGLSVRSGAGRVCCGCVLYAPRTVLVSRST